ncbi:leucine-rich repeat domain-containing protein [Thermophilibacter provencensis]|uniref:leucine-rich repeat domain-containing protein n=1 Tax=Thermophilibacter provencensis TaxID=1852386 RepID=UPI00338DFCCD
MGDRVHCINEGCISTDGVLIVPEGTVEIPLCLFEGNGLLKKVILPKGLKTVGPRAFSCCSNLEEIELPRSLSFIGEHAFSSCSLRDLVVPSGVKTVAPYAFSSCGRLVHIVLDEGVTAIESHAFENCGSPDAEIKVDLPESIVSIADDAFDRERTTSAIKPVLICAPPGSFAHQWAKEHASDALRAWD